MGSVGEWPGHSVRQRRVWPGIHSRHRSATRATGGTLLAAGSQEPGDLAGPAERPGAAGPAPALAALVDRPRDGIPALTSPSPERSGTIDLHVHSTASDGSVSPEE